MEEDKAEDSGMEKTQERTALNRPSAEEEDSES